MNYKKNITPFSETSIETKGSDTISFFKEYYRFIDDKRWYDYLKELDLTFNKKASNSDKEYYETRSLNWATTLSGSRSSKVYTNPIGLLLFFFGVVTEEQLNDGLQYIPNLNTLAEYGNFREEEILSFNEAAVATLNGRTNINKPRIHYYELFNSSRANNYQTERFKKVFKGLYLRAFKETMFKEGELKTLNVDGLAFNSKVELEYVVEIKTKGLEVTAFDVAKSHIHQASFYADMLKPKKGVIFLFSRGDRTYDFFVINNKDLDNFNKNNNYLKEENKFLKIYSYVLSYILNDDIDDSSSTLTKTPHWLKTILSFKMENNSSINEKLINMLLKKYVKEQNDNGQKKELINIFKLLLNNSDTESVITPFINTEKLEYVVNVIKESIIEQIGLDDLTSGVQELKNKESEL